MTTNLLKKIIITILVACGYLYGAFGLSKTEAAELLRVALVQGQTTAEISCTSDFEVQNGWEKSLLPKGKYFLHVVEGRLVMEQAAEKAMLPPPVSQVIVDSKLQAKEAKKAKKNKQAKKDSNNKVIVSNKPVTSVQEKQQKAELLASMAQQQDLKQVESTAPKQFSFGSTIYLNALEGGALPKINQKAYKGYLRVLADNGKLLVVNYVELEQYLSSVLPAKTMVVWPDEGIKAQAVAARSYALYMRRQNANKHYDLLAVDEELPYEGTGPRIEKAGVTKLIKATQGQYLVDASGLPIEAVTTSSSGGRTEDAVGAWGREVPYLQSVEDFDNDSPEFSWQHVATPALLEGQLAQRGYVVGKLNSVRLSPLDDMGDDRTATGRVRYVILTGTAGTIKISGEELAEIVGLPSTLFDVEAGTPPPETLKIPIEDRYGFEVGSKDIDIKVKEDEHPVWNKLLRSYHMLSGGKNEKLIFHGRGRGMGLGLSAWGARGMVNANEKITCRQILEHYYPGTSLVG